MVKDCRHCICEIPYEETVWDIMQGAFNEVRRGNPICKQAIVHEMVAKVLEQSNGCFVLPARARFLILFFATFLVVFGVGAT
jgi:hypothetical protein